MRAYGCKGGCDNNSYSCEKFGIRCTWSCKHCYCLNCSYREEIISFEENKDDECENDFPEIESETKYATESESNTSNSDLSYLQLSSFHSDNFYEWKWI